MNLPCGKKADILHFGEFETFPMRAIRESLVQALANSYHVGASEMPCATGALPLACILVALARTTTLFVGNGLCAVPFSLRGAWGRHAGRPLRHGRTPSPVVGEAFRLPL